MSIKKATTLSVATFEVETVQHFPLATDVRKKSTGSLELAYQTYRAERIARQHDEEDGCYVCTVSLYVVHNGARIIIADTAIL